MNGIYKNKQERKKCECQEKFSKDREIRRNIYFNSLDPVVRSIKERPWIKSGVKAF